MGNLDESLISAVVQRPTNFVRLQRAGVVADDFLDQARDCWRFLSRIKQQQGVIPSKTVVESRFPDIELVKTEPRDLPVLLEELKQRRKWRSLLDIIDEAATDAASPENVDDALQHLQSSANQLMSANGSESHLLDVFHETANRRMYRDIKKRKFGQKVGVPTGLKRIDALGGMHKQRMMVVIGRPSLGKSWLSLLFVANAVMSGHKFILYPLEMTFEETALRLYTIFSQKMFGTERALKNTDLIMGKITKRKMVQFLHVLEDKFSGLLYVADVGSLADPYTNERIEAEQQLYKPDGFWVDYITLMKAPEMKKGGEDYSAIRYLSSGIKGTAMRQNVIGGCSAQVNREALKVRSFIPRLEHIAYGDSIGQDADQVVSINRRGQYLYYGMVKNRHGPEIGTTRVNFFVNSGLIEESKDQGSMEDDE